jgi:hypothetical protein
MAAVVAANVTATSDAGTMPKMMRVRVIPS